MQVSNLPADIYVGGAPIGAGDRQMGIVVEFPETAGGRRGSRSIAAGSESATVIILPVVRIEHYDDEPTEDESGSGQRRGRRRS